jgi:hypothetical protein
MRQIGPYLIVRKTEFPYFKKAHRIARELSEQRLDDILEHRYHLHKNPRKKLNVGGSEQCQANTETAYSVREE